MLNLSNAYLLTLSLQDPGNEACLNITLFASILFRGLFVLKLNEVERRRCVLFLRFKFCLFELKSWLSWAIAAKTSKKTAMHEIEPKNDKFLIL